MPFVFEDDDKRGEHPRTQGAVGALEAPSIRVKQSICRPTC